MIITSALSFSICACSGEEESTNTHQDLTIMFHAVAGETHVSCGAPFALNAGAEPTFHVQDLRLYVYDVELKSTSGDWVPFTFEADGEWSDGRVTLLDYEDGTKRCDESGNLLMNHQIKGSLPNGDYQAIRFRVGVPPELNHQDVTTADAPLNTSSMFWVWQRGYKFARIELVEELGGDIKPWFFHLGSTGCESEAATIAPESPCSNTNSPWVTVEDFDLTSEHIAFDLRGLLSGLELSENTEETPVGCMSMPMESVECAPLFENLGLSFDSGEVTPCEGGDCPAVFRSMRNDHNHDHDHHAHGDHEDHEDHENHEDHEDHDHSEG